MIRAEGTPTPTDRVGHVAYWRIVLRGCSQLCFQSNALTGLFFLLAVLVVSPIAAAYLLVAAIVAPAGRMLLGEKNPGLATGLPGMNPCLIALSLPAFFVTGWTNVAMWIVLLVCVASTVLLVRLCLKVLPFPTLALPFLIIFWILYALEPQVAFLEPLSLAPQRASTFQPLTAVIFSLGQTLFAPSIGAGLLFATGMFVSNWRTALIAILGATIGTVVSYYYHNLNPTDANFGLYGFNGVLTAVAVYEFCGGKLRLAILGALIATILTPVIAAFGVQTLSAPYVFTTWLMLGLGWFEEHWFSLPQAPSTPGGFPSNANSQLA